MATAKMPQSSTKIYFILVSGLEIAYKQETKSFHDFVVLDHPTPVIPGSFWFSLDVDCGSTSISGDQLLSLQALEGEDILTLTCARQAVERLQELEYHLLAALTTCRERLSLYNKEKDRFKAICELVRQWQLSANENLTIDVIDEYGYPECIPGELKYVGPIPNRCGYWFGVKLSVVSNSIV